MPKLSFTLVQAPLAWQNPNENLAYFTPIINTLKGKTHVVVLPEMFSTGFSMQASSLAQTMQGPTLQWMAEMASQNGVIIAGSVIITENNKYYNRLIWMQPNGTAHTYDKRHCFSLAGEDKVYTAGTEKVIVQANGVKVNLQICYDLRFPVWSRQTKTNAYDVLLYVANWPSKRIYAWQQLLIARAIENQCYIVAVNRIGTDANNNDYNGQSCIVNPLGNVLFNAMDKECVYTYTIDTNTLTEVRQSLPFLNDADDFTITSF
jgi:omega-amidase